MNDKESNVNVAEKCENDNLQCDKTSSTNDDVNKKKKNRKTTIKRIMLPILLMIAMVLFIIGIFVRGNNLENLLYYARVPISDGSSQAIVRIAKYCVPASIILFILTNLIIQLSYKYREKLKSFSLKNRLNFPFRQMKFLFKRGYLISFFVIILSILYIGYQTNSAKYIAGMFRTTTIYEENYVAPEDQTFVFPEKKKNLCYIMLESMESSYADVESGGVMEENYIPNLTRLAQENISFSDTQNLGGAQFVTGTGWTVAGIVSQSSGIPLTIPISNLNFGKDNTFLPGVHTLGEVLDKEGYNQTVMMGSKASYAKQEDYYVQHGNYKIFDYYTATGQKDWHHKIKGMLPKDYYEWWGFEDYKLFEYAKGEMEYLASNDAPFHLNVITIDTHFYDGYMCEKCPDTFGNQYANVINCSDKLVSDFVDWIQNHPNPRISEDTVIVICGDHLTMDNAYFDSVDKNSMKRGRRIYNCFINTGLSDKHSKNRDFTSMDMYPTILASLGVEWDESQLGLGVNLFSGDPTLSEKLGVDNFSYQITSNSDFYSEYIMKNNSSYNKD